MWNLHSSKNYSVNNAHNFHQQLATQHNIVVDNPVVWHKDSFLKVNLFVWRLLLNRLPIKDNLFKRGVIPATSQSCVEGVVI